jgi:hypothetical protein
MTDDYQNETYLGLLEKLGPEQSLILIDKLIIDLQNTQRGLKAAQSAKANDMLSEPSHVLISLAGVIGTMQLHTIAQDINNLATIHKAEFPTNLADIAIKKIDNWLVFLKSDKKSRNKAL